MDLKDTRIGPRPDNPPPYSVEPPSQPSYPETHGQPSYPETHGQTSYAAQPSGQSSFAAQPPGQTSFAAQPPRQTTYAAPQTHMGYATVTPGSVPYRAVPQPGQSHVYITTQPGAVVQTVIVQQMGPVPTSMVCKSCNIQIVTRVEMNPTIRTHLFAIMLCVIGCWPLACVPYCIDSCYNAEHYCPNCNAYIGSYIS